MVVVRSQSNPKRPPLLPSERENGVSAINAARKPRSREVSSRYLSSSSSSSNASSTSSNFSNSSLRRCPSPVPARIPAKNPARIPVPATTPKRSLSAERRRPATPRTGGEMSAAAKMLVSSSMRSTRSLSVSFQGESFAVPTTTKPRTPLRTGTPERRMTSSLTSATPGSLRRGTPERRMTTSSSSTTLKGSPRKSVGENARPASFEHQPWPGRSSSLSSSRPPMSSLSRSVDLGGSKKKVMSGSSSSSGRVVRDLQVSLVGGESNNRTTCGNDRLRRSMSRDEIVNASCVSRSNLGSESLVSDTESVSSECNSRSQDSNTSVVKGGRSVVVPARIWQEANNRLKPGSEPGSPMAARNSTLKGTVPSKLVVVPRKFLSDSPGASPRGNAVSSTRGFSSPLRGPVRPSSPSRLSCSPSRGMASPLRARSSGSSTPSILSFGADVRRAKVGDNRLDDAHYLRLLHNRNLQWRFVNARTEASLSVQKRHAERSLYNAWSKISDLREVVSSRRKELLWLMQKLKLLSILKSQMLYLEEWALMDKDHCSSLSGAAESLKARVILLPVVGGARIDIDDMKDAVCSAADVMQGMASSICFLLPKVEGANSLVGEVAGVTSEEHSLLNECKEILSTLVAMQVKVCSLRAHILQLKCTPSSLTVEV